MKSISCKVLLVVVCIFVFYCCGGGSKKNEGNTIVEADSNTELETEITEGLNEKQEDPSAEPNEAELEVEETGEVIIEEEELDILPADKNSYIAPHDPEMVVKDDGVSIVVNRIKVMLKEGEGKETADELAKKVNGTVVGFIEPDIYQIELQTSTVKELENALSTVEADARVKVAIKTSFSKTDKGIDIVNIDSEKKVWGYKQIKIIEAWEAIKNAGIVLDANIKVAIFDSGLDRFHSEFKEINIRGENLIPNGPLSYYDDYGHGTNVAGIIAAANNGQEINGILTGLNNNNFELQIYKMLDKDGYSNSDAMDMAFPHAANNGARVANLSIGTDPSLASYFLSHYEDWKRAKEYYKEMLLKYPDVLFVISVGNENMDAAFFFPSSTPVPNVISVAATNKKDERCSFSNYGNNVHIAAPGADIWTTRSSSDVYLYFDENYKYANGTSMSAPFVAGVAALLFQIDPSLTPVEVKSILIDTADEVETDKGTWKRLNALNAVNFVINRLKSASPEPIHEQPVIEPQLLPLSDDIEPEQEPDPVIIPPPPVNHPPVVSNVSLSGTGIYDGGTGDVTVTYTLTDADNDTCDITVEYRYDLAEDSMSSNPKWHSATITQETFNVTPGNRSVTWQSGKDAPYFGAHKIRITPTDTETGVAGISNWFEIDNNPWFPNTAPTVRIEKPANNSVFYKGNKIEFSAAISDAEDWFVWSCMWSSNVDGELGSDSSGQESFLACYISDSDPCNLSFGDHTITLTVKDSEGLTGTDSIAITINDKYETFLVERDDKTYYCQNQKPYPVDPEILEIMVDSGLPGWDHYKNDHVFVWGNRAQFISDGIVIREIGTDPVYVVFNNKLRWIRSVKALNWLNPNGKWEEDIIDVPSDIIFRYEQGNDIFALTDIRFVRAYCGDYSEGHNDACQWPGSYVSDILDFPITQVETALVSGRSGISGTYQTFGDESNTRGAIDSSELGTYVVHGAIYTKYREVGYSGSELGFPTSNEYTWPFPGENYRRSDFEGGYIYWIPSIDEARVVYEPTSDESVITFFDSNLEAIVRDALGIGDATPITVGLAHTLTELNASNVSLIIGDQSRCVEHFDALKYFTNLTKLELKNQYFLVNTSFLSHLTKLEYLDLVQSGIVSLVSLTNLHSLKSLFLELNNISDITPLAGLTNLVSLSLGFSFQLDDFSPLANLVNLTDLSLHSCNISDVSFASNMVNLKYLNLCTNDIEDIGILVNVLGDGASLHLMGNPLGTDDCPDIQVLIDKGVTVWHDVNCQ